jgi:hypothetical protein
LPCGAFSPTNRLQVSPEAAPKAARAAPVFPEEVAMQDVAPLERQCDGKAGEAILVGAGRVKVLELEEEVLKAARWADCPALQERGEALAEIANGVVLQRRQELSEGLVEAIRAGSAHRVNLLEEPQPPGSGADGLRFIQYRAGTNVARLSRKPVAWGR